MKSVNKVTLLGAVGRDPEIRYTASGMAVATFSIATTKKAKDKNDVTMWHNCVAFAGTGELVGKYVRAGSKLYVEGEIQYQEYEKDGQKRTATKIVINDIAFLGDSGNHSSGASKQKASDKNIQNAKHSAQLEDDEVPF